MMFTYEMTLKDQNMSGNERIEILRGGSKRSIRDWTTSRDPPNSLVKGLFVVVEGISF